MGLVVGFSLISSRDIVPNGYDDLIHKCAENHSKSYVITVPNSYPPCLNMYMYDILQ